jgi:hypothetical protein
MVNAYDPTAFKDGPGPLGRRARKVIGRAGQVDLTQDMADAIDQIKVDNVKTHAQLDLIITMLRRQNAA